MKRQRALAPRRRCPRSRGRQYTPRIRRRLGLGGWSCQGRVACAAVLVTVVVYRERRARARK